MPRPSVGKSTTFTLDIPLWLIARNRAIRGATFSNSQSAANRYVMRVKRVLERTVPVMGDPEEIAKGLALDAVACMADDFGLFRPAQRGDRWAREEFVVEQLHSLPIDEKESTWTAFGFDSSYIGMRLDVLVADDVVDKKTIKTQEAVAKQREDWDDVAERRIDPGGLLLLQGQRLEPETCTSTAGTSTRTPATTRTRSTRPAKTAAPCTTTSCSRPITPSAARASTRPVPPLTPTAVCWTPGA